MIRNARWLLVCSAASGVALPACTFIVDKDGDQCETTEDCVARGPAFAGSTCSKEKVCTTGLQSCQSSQDCIQANGGLPYICRNPDKVCAPLLSQDCTSVLPNGVVGNDNAIFFGFLGPLVPGPEAGQDFSSIGIPIKQGVELALEEIKTNKTGLPGVSGGAARPLALIACHDLGDPTRAAKHLAETVRVPAIVGPAFSGITITVVSDVTVPAGVVTMSASATSPAITTLEDNNLAWRTVPSDALQAIPLASLLSYVEARVRTEQGLSASDRVRVAMTIKGDAYGTGLANALTPLMTFNGKGAAENGSDFLQKQYEDPSAGAMVDFAKIVSEIVGFEPHIVMPMGTNEGITDVLGGIEAAWPTVAPIPPRPYYVFPDGGRLDELLTAVNTNNQLRARIVGTKPGRQGDAYNAFKLRYRAAFDNVDPGTYAENAYDAAYLLSYAVLAGGASPPTGASIVQGLGKSIGGSGVEAGPDGISTAFQALGGGGAIDYDGASGPLDFDLKTGEARADVETWCVGLDQNGEATFLFGGQYYDAANDEVTGTFQPCCKAPNAACTSNNECCSGTCSTTNDTCI